MPSRNHSLTTSSPLNNPRLQAISKGHYDDHNYDWNHIQSDKIPDSNQVFPSSCLNKVEKILKGSLDSILSPSIKIQIMGSKICLRC